MIFQNMISAITSPKSAFLRIKDKKSKIVGYLLFLILLMSLPTIILGIIRADSLFLSSETLNVELVSFTNKDLEISNYRLVAHDVNLSETVDVYHFTVGDVRVSTAGFIFKLAEEGIETYYAVGQGMTIPIDMVSYEELNVENLNLSGSNINVLVNMVTKAFSLNTQIVLTVLFSNILAQAFSLLLAILFLSMLSNINKRIPIKFSHHFKVNTYLASSYAVAMLIFSLFNLRGLGFVALIIYYIYYFVAYNSIRVVSRKKGDRDE